MDNYLLKTQKQLQLSTLWLQQLGIAIITILLVSFVETAHAQPTFVYSYNAHTSGPNKISGFSVAADGNVTTIPGSPFVCNGGGPSGSISPAPSRMVIAGNFLFASGGASINAFFINSQTGTLTPLQGSPFSTVLQSFIGGEGISLAVTPDRKYLFAGGADIGVIQTFSIALDGTLTPVSILPLNGARYGLRGMKVSPNGKFLAVGLNGSAISGRPFFLYKISGDGSLSFILGPFVTNGNGRATDMEFNCDSNLLFVVGDTVTPIYTDVFNVSLEGYLSAIPGSPFVQRSGNLARGGQTTFLSPNGKLLFVNEAFGNKITVWNIASDGTLTLVSGSGFLSGGSQPERMVMDKEGKWLFIANLFGNDNLGGFSIVQVAPDGVLSPFTTPTVVVGNDVDRLLSLAVFPPKSCSALPPTFDICLQDEGSSSFLGFNSTTGEYQFTRCGGVTVGGTATITKKGCTLTLQHNAADRRLTVKVDTCQNKATASLQLLSSGAMYSITDRNTLNNTCSCP